MEFIQIVLHMKNSFLLIFERLMNGGMTRSMVISMHWHVVQFIFTKRKHLQCVHLLHFYFIRWIHVGINIEDQ